MKKAYLLYFVYDFDDGHEDTILLGVFSSKEKAKNALSELKKKPEFKGLSKGFVIDKNTIDRVSWEEGYTTIDYA
jgi:hypothetical protein